MQVGNWKQCHHLLKWVGFCPPLPINCRMYLKLSLFTREESLSKFQMFFFFTSENKRKLLNSEHLPTKYWRFFLAFFFPGILKTDNADNNALNLETKAVNTPWWPLTVLASEFRYLLLFCSGCMTYTITTGYLQKGCFRGRWNNLMINVEE